MSIAIPFLSAKDGKPTPEKFILELQLSQGSLSEAKIEYIHLQPTGCLEVGFLSKLPPPIEIQGIHNGLQSSFPLSAAKWYVDKRKVTLEKVKSWLDQGAYNGLRSMDVVAMIEIDGIEYYAELQLGYDSNVK